MIAGALLAVALYGPVRPVAQAPAPAAVTYVVKPGDCLWSIAGRVTGHSDRWPVLYSANRSIVGANPNLVYAGERLRLPWIRAVTPRRPREAASATLGKRRAGHRTTSRRTPIGPAQRREVVPSGQLDCAGLERLWTLAGGNPVFAGLAASIAMAESGGSQYAHSPTDDYGYWQINAAHGALATYDAMGNARAAVIISGDSTDWQPWTTYVSGAYIGRC